MKATIRTYLCLGLLAAPSFAQEQKPTSTAFEKALAVEELEHDLKGAAKLYTELALAKNTPDKLQRRAYLRLGLVYRQLGQEDKAQAALGKAAGGAGDLALLAKEAMQKPDGVSEEQIELRRQAEIALEQARAAVPRPSPEQLLGKGLLLTGFWSPAAEDLVWLGSASVPTIRRELAPWLETEKLNPLGAIGLFGTAITQSRSFQVSYRAFLCSILWENGSAEARACLAELASSPEEKSQMAVAQGLLECGSLNPTMLSLYAEISSRPNGFIAAIRAANKSAAMTNRRRSAPILTQLSAEKFLKLVDTVPQAVAVDLWRHLDALDYRISGLEAKHLDLAGSIRTMLNSPHPGLNQVGYKALAKFGLQSVSMRLLTLQFIDRLPEGFHLKGARTRQVIGDSGVHIGGNLVRGAEEITLFAKAVADVGQAPLGKGVGNAKSKLIESFANTYYKYGDFGVLPVAMELVRFGYWNKRAARQWLESNGLAAHLPMVTKAMETSPMFDGGFDWIKKQTLNKENVPGIVAALTRLHTKGVQDRLKDTDGNKYPGAAWSPWFAGLDCLAKIDDPSVLAYLVHLAGNGELAAAGERLLEMSRSGIMGELLHELRVTLAAQVVGEPSRYELDTRSQILARLIELGDVETMIDTAGWSGLEFNNPNRLGFGLTQRSSRRTERDQFAFVWLVVEASSKRGTPKPFHGYSAKQLATIWSHHFEHPNSFPGLNPYTYLYEGLRMRSSRSESFKGLVIPATRAWIRRLKASDSPKGGELEGLRELQKRCLGEDRESEPMNPMGMELISLSLRSGNAEVALGAVAALGLPGDEHWQEDVRSWLTDSEVGRSALYYLDRLGLTLSDEEFRRIIACDVRAVRKRMIEGVAQLAPKASVELLLPLLADDSSDIRVRTCAALAQRLDANAVPALLKVLGDSDDNVRKAAKEALQQIRFFHDEKARWERFFQGQEVSTVGAAQMLLQQASKDQPLDTRLLAIRSLGTLAAPETLPFLIQWAAQGPPEVASAAKSAIERINLAGSPVVDVK